MNWDTVEGQWSELKGAVKSKWGKLTDQDLVTLGGKKEVFLGKLQKLYGINKDQAEQEVDEWLKNDPSLNPPRAEKSAAHR
jgi:uncharacterized protein YjbJ (UPF0337 family)